MWMCPSQDRYQAACARTRNAAQQPSCQTIHLPGWTCNDEQRAQENHATAIVAACSTEQGDFQIHSLGQGWPSVSLIKFSLSKENSKTYVCLGQQRERERERERERPWEKPKFQHYHQPRKSLHSAKLAQTIETLVFNRSKLALGSP